MPRHSKNNTASAVFTYHERQMIKDYGTQAARIGQNSTKKFGMCSMYLHDLQDPLCCPKGHVFCKACGIEHLVIQKKEQEKQKILYEQYKQQKKEQQGKQDTNEQQKIDNFLKLEEQFDPKARKQIHKTNITDIKEEKIDERQKMHNEYKTNIQNQTREEKIKTSFWMPENMKSSEEQVKKPKSYLQCPSALNHEVKIKKLVPLHIKSGTGDEKYVCYVCQKYLQFQKIGTSKKCGHVQCLACIQLSVKESKSCGYCMKSCDKSDLIEIESSQSSFASHNSVEAKVYTHQITI